MIVACVLVKANVPYTVDYVRRLRWMVARNLKQPHRFICFTDQPDAVQRHCEAYAIASPSGGRPGWWSKLELFNPGHKLSGPGLYLDLDVLIIDDLAPIASVATEGLVLIPDAGSFNGRDGLAVVKRYNSSVMRIEFGSCDRLYSDFDRSVTSRLWGDQDWIGEQMPYCDTMPLEWFPRLSEIRDPPRWPAAAKVVLCKRPKNHVAAAQWPWFDQMWR